MAKHDQLKPHQWQPGHSGNPGGRPKGVSPKERAMAFLGYSRLKLLEITRLSSSPMVDRIAAKMVMDALETEDPAHTLRAFDSLADRIDGRATAHQEVVVTPLDMVQLEDRRMHKGLEEPEEESKEIGDGSDD